MVVVWAFVQIVMLNRVSRVWGVVASSFVVRVRARLCRARPPQNFDWCSSWDSGGKAVARVCALLKLVPRPARSRAKLGRGPTAPPGCCETRPVPGRPNRALRTSGPAGLASSSPLGPVARVCYSSTVIGHSWGHPPESPLGSGGSVLRESSGSRLSPGTAPLRRARGLATIGHKAWSYLRVGTPDCTVAGFWARGGFSSNPQVISRIVSCADHW